MASLLLIGGRGSPSGTAIALPTPGEGAVEVVPDIQLSAPENVVRRLPAGRWVVSFDVLLQPGSELSIGMGSRAHHVVIRRDQGGLPTLQARRRSRPLATQPGWPPTQWRHIELYAGKIAVDGRAFAVSAGFGRELSLDVLHGSGEVRALIASAAADRAALPFHRLVELHAQQAAGPSLALWEAAMLQSAGAMFRKWALAATLAQPDGESSLAAWRALCRSRAGGPAVCAQLRGAALTAANAAVALAGTNPGSGTIPTSAKSPRAETTVTSVMDLGILTWATRVTHNPTYARLARHQAQVVGALLVGADGSTSGAVWFDRQTGRIQSTGTATAPGSGSLEQGSALYGFAQTASELHDHDLLTIAQRLGGYVAAHAPVGASSGAVTAAGLLQLASACKLMPGACSDPSRWVSLAQSTLTESLSRVSTRSPIPPLALSYMLQSLRLEANLRR